MAIEDATQTIVTNIIINRIGVISSEAVPLGCQLKIKLTIFISVFDVRKLAWPLIFVAFYGEKDERCHGLNIKIWVRYHFSNGPIARRSPISPKAFAAFIRSRELDL
jgi:hypothetical protein